MASLLNRPAGSGRGRLDTYYYGTGTWRGGDAHYCAKCRSVQPTTIIRGYNGARDHQRCESCGRTWPR